MKKTSLIFVSFLLLLTQAPTTQQQFDSKGQYVGKTITLPDNKTTMQYDKNGAYIGKSVLQPDGKTVFYYDKNGRYVGKNAVGR